MHPRVSLQNVVSAIALPAALSLFVGACSPADDASRTLVAGFTLDTTGAIDLETSIDGVDADEPPGPTVTAGTSAIISYVVINASGGLLSNVLVTDDDASLIVNCPKDTLEAGETMTCTAQAATDEGPHGSTATVTAVDPASIPVTDSDATHYVVESVVEAQQGCGIGYWKNHAAAWEPTGHAPADTLASVFSAASAYPGLADLTLEAALRLPGGPDVEDAAGLLLKHAVAALLSTTHPDLEHALTEAEVVEIVNEALDSADRQTILQAKARLAPAGEMHCPLDALQEDASREDAGEGRMGGPRHGGRGEGKAD